MDIYGGSLVSVLLVSLSSCAGTNSTPISEPISKTAAAETPIEEPIFKPADSEEHAIMMWQKQPGTTTYNGQGEPIGSLRFIPKVRAYDRMGEWLRIDPQDDIWVRASDVSENKPDNLLAVPENTAPLPRIDIQQERETD